MAVSGAAQVMHHPDCHLDEVMPLAIRPQCVPQSPFCSGFADLSQLFSKSATVLLASRMLVPL
jgi:hypothetical protein